MNIAGLVALTGLALFASACRGPLVLVNVSRTRSVPPGSVVTVTLNGTKVDELNDLPLTPTALQRGYQYDHDVGEIIVTLQLTVPGTSGVLDSLVKTWTGSTIIWTAGATSVGTGGAGGAGGAGGVGGAGSAGRAGGPGGVGGRSMSSPGSGGGAGGMGGTSDTGANGGGGGSSPPGSGGLPGSGGSVGGRPGSGGVATGGSGGGTGGRGGGAGSGPATGGALGSGGVMGSGGVLSTGGIMGAGGVMASGGVGSPGTGGGATGGTVGSGGQAGAPSGGTSGNGGGAGGKGAGGKSGAGGAPTPNCVTNSSAVCTCSDYCAAITAYCPNEGDSYFPDGPGDCAKTCASFGWVEVPFSNDLESLSCRVVAARFGHCPRVNPAGDGSCESHCANFCSILARNCPTTSSQSCMTMCPSFNWSESGDLVTTSSGPANGNCHLYWAAFAGRAGIAPTDQATACANAGPTSNVCH